MNILLTSAGRRTYMVEYFKNALYGLHIEGHVFASNSAMSPALEAADAYFITPLIYDEAYIPYLLEKCREYHIGMLIPLFDVDLPVLSAHKKEFEAIGVKAIVSDPETIGICRDKYALSLRLSSWGLNSPGTLLSPDQAMEETRSGSIKFPLIIKPRFGMGSIGLYRVYDETELKGAYSMCSRCVAETYLKYESQAVPDKSVILQELIGGREYGLDIISGFDGNYLATIVRRKIAMRAGETDEAVILGKNDPEYDMLSGLGASLAGFLKPSGLIDADVIMDTESMEPCVIDINARFGGGYPFSHMAGADVPRAYILSAEGRGGEALSFLAPRPHAASYKDIVLRKHSV